MNKRTRDVLKGRLLEVERWTLFGMFVRRLFADEVAQLGKVSFRTAQRYILHPESIPKNTRELIEIKALGLIPDQGFEGWPVKDGYMISPANIRVNADEVNGSTHHLSLPRYGHMLTR